jgi:hypothetical protein
MERKSASSGTTAAHGPDENETATGLLEGNASSTDNLMDDCLGSCETAPKNLLLPAASTTA